MPPTKKNKNIPREIKDVGRTDTLTVGAQKALEHFIDEYGPSKGVRVYLAKADERGVGSTLRQKVNFTYKKGARLPE